MVMHCAPQNLRRNDGRHTVCVRGRGCLMQGEAGQGVRRKEKRADGRRHPPFRDAPVPHHNQAHVLRVTARNDVGQAQFMADGAYNRGNKAKFYQLSLTRNKAKAVCLNRRACSSQKAGITYLDVAR
jgi:hypothetical protein